MPERRPEIRHTAPAVSDRVAPPHTYIYAGRDAHEDRLLSGLLAMAEALAASVEHGPRDGCARVAHALSDAGAGEDLAQPDAARWMAELAATALAMVDGPRRRVVDELMEALAENDLLSLLARQILPGGRPVPARDADGRLLLSEREVEVLREAAADLPREQMARRLGISERTLNRHLDHVYRKLGVSRPMQAVARAISMGYLEMDVVEWVAQAGAARPRDWGVLASEVSAIDCTLLQPADSRLALLGRVGLTLLLASCLGARIARDDAHLRTLPRDRLLLLDGDWQVVRAVEDETLWHPRSSAVAPPEAARHGFTPGSVFVLDYGRAVDGLNRSVVVELTPQGVPVRSFSGARHVAARLVNSTCLCFDRDGRLLVGSGGPTDALLAFTEGGARVCRFADGCMTAACVGPGGRVYATQSSSVGSVVKVLSPAGELLCTMGETGPGEGYGVRAVLDGGDLLAHHERAGEHTLVRFDADGRLAREWHVPGYCGGAVLPQPDGSMLVLCGRSCDVKRLPARGRPTVAAQLPADLRPYHAVPAQQGGWWMCAGPAA